MNRPRSADFSPQEPAPGWGRPCGLKPALLNGSGSPCPPVLPAAGRFMAVGQVRKEQATLPERPGK